MLLLAAAAIVLSISSFAASSVDGVVVSVVVDRNSGITPQGSFSAVNGIDNKSYYIYARTQSWFEEWQYRWSDWNTASPNFGFKSFDATIIIPAKASVPTSSNTTLYIPDFYMVFGFTVSSVSDCYINFSNSSGQLKKVPLKASINNNIVSFDEASVELGSGSWSVSEVVISASFPSTVLISTTSYFALSGFEFSMTTSLSASDFISQQTQDIIKNDVVPAVDNLNNTMNNVNSSVEDVNKAVAAVGQAVQQGNNKLTELNNAVNELPNDVVAALDQKAEQEVNDLTNAADEALDDINNLIFGEDGFKFDTFTAALDSLKSSFTSTVRAESITFPAGKLPNFSFLPGSNTTLWEEQTIDIKGMLDKIPPVFLVVVRSFFSVSIIVAVILSLCKFLSSLINSNVDDSEE